MQTDWKNVILPAYEVRKRKKQKTAFIDMLKERFGDRMRVEESGSLVKNRNIVLGDPDSADVIFTAHYDTCAGLPFPNFITPRNLFLFILYQIGISLLFVVPIFALDLLAAWLCRGLPDFWGILVTEAVLILGLLGVLWIFMGDHPNLHNANDNTSGVVTVLTLAELLADSGKNAAFVLFDNEENGLLGSAAFAAAHKAVRTSTLIVNFDCVSDGGHILALFSKPAQKLPFYDAARNKAVKVFSSRAQVCEVCPKKGTIYPSDQANFKVSAAVCALNESKRIGLYMNKIHTAKDTVFEEDNIAALTELFSSDALFASFGTGGTAPAAENGT